MKIQLLLLSSILLAVGPVFANDDSDSVKVNGVTFNIAKDRKIEKVGGIYEPEGIDKYVDRRVSELSDRLQQMEAKMNETNQKLDKITMQLTSQASSTTLVSSDSSSSESSSGASPFKPKDR